MTRLIDADALKTTFREVYKVNSDGVIGRVIDDAQTIDAVPVVRCKDCRWGRETCGNIECNMEYHGFDWFCPNGKRKEK